MPRNTFQVGVRDETTPFFLHIRGHQFLATPQACGEWRVNRVIHGTRQSFVIGVFTVLAHEHPESSIQARLPGRLVQVAEEDPEGWQNAWTADQIEQAEADASYQF